MQVGCIHGSLYTFVLVGDCTGTRINFHYHAGYPSVRHNVAQKFADLDGFTKFLEYLKLPTTGWLGTDKLQVIMKTLSEVRSASDTVPSLIVLMCMLYSCSLLPSATMLKKSCWMLL
jgi:hypothetical protein